MNTFIILKPFLSDEVMLSSRLGDLKSIKPVWNKYERFSIFRTKVFTSLHETEHFSADVENLI